MRSKKLTTTTTTRLSKFDRLASILNQASRSAGLVGYSKVFKAETAADLHPSVYRRIGSAGFRQPPPECAVPHRSFRWLIKLSCHRALYQFPANCGTGMAPPARFLAREPLGGCTTARNIPTRGSIRPTDWRAYSRITWYLRTKRHSNDDRFFQKPETLAYASHSRKFLEQFFHQVTNGWVLRRTLVNANFS